MVESVENLGKWNADRSRRRALRDVVGEAFQALQEVCASCFYSPSFLPLYSSACAWLAFIGLGSLPKLRDPVTLNPKPMKEPCSEAACLAPLL